MGSLGDCLQIQLLQRMGTGFYLLPCPRPGSGMTEELTGTVLQLVPDTLVPDRSGSQHGPLGLGAWVGAFS